MAVAWMLVLDGPRRVGKAKRAHHSFCGSRWWARRKRAFAHPCNSAIGYRRYVPKRNALPRTCTPRQAAGDRIEPTLSSLWLPRSVIVVSTFIGPGWLPEQLGSLHKAGSTKMTQTTTTTAGIDTSKSKL